MVVAMFPRPGHGQIPSDAMATLLGFRWRDFLTFARPSTRSHMPAKFPRKSLAVCTREPCVLEDDSSARGRLLDERHPAERRPVRRPGDDAERLLRYRT